MRDEPNVGLRCLTARSSDTIKGVVAEDMVRVGSLAGAAHPSNDNAGDLS